MDRWGAPVMRLHYLHSANVQMPSANAVQTLHMCEAFAMEGADVELSYPRYAWGNVVPFDECHAYYGVSRRFRLRPLRAPFTSTLMRTPGYLPAAKLWAYTVATLADTFAGAGRKRDIIYTRCATAALAMPFLGRLRAGARPLTVFEAHEYPRDRRRARGLRYVDAVVAITHAAARDLQTGLGLDGNRILVAPDGVPDAWLGGVDKREARAQLGLPEQAALVVYTGKVHRDTLPLLLETAEGIRRRAELIVVGAPPGPVDDAAHVSELQEQARQRALPVRFVGIMPVERVRLYQAAADVLIAPYSGQLRWARYASPLKVFEYMAAGRPMVVSDLPVLREVIAHDDTAWLVPPASGAAMAEGVRTVLDHQELAARLAARARAAAPNFTWSRRARTILDFLARRRWEIR